MSTMDSTHAKILDGAMRAVGRRGIAKLAMRDVGACAGVARGTVYRHFPNREALLAEMAQHEAERFMSRWRATLGEAPPERRIQVAFEYPARFARENPLLQRLIETDPDYVVREIRERFPAIRRTIGKLLGPVIAETDLARQGVASVDQLVDWAARIMISVFLVPGREQESLGKGAAAIHRTLSH